MNSTTQEKLLAQAERLCQQRNVRLTPQRLEVLRLMTQQPGAISAYDLLDLLRVAEPQAKPPTVYRALDFLLEQGFIHRVESANSYVLCHHFEQPMHTSALFICDRCGGDRTHYRRRRGNAAEAGAGSRICAAAQRGGSARPVRRLRGG